MTLTSRFGMESEQAVSGPHLGSDHLLVMATIGLPRFLFYRG